MNQIESSVVSWMNSNELTTPTRTIEDLCNGHALMELMNQVNPEIFRMEDINQDRSTWMYKFGNISKLLKGLEAYYNDVLSIIDTRIFSSVECAKIAKFNHIPTLFNLLELIVAAIVKCPSSEKFIERITQLNEVVEADLMMIIKSSLEKIDKKPEEASEPNDIRRELQHLREEKRNLEVHLEEFQKALTETGKEREVLLRQKSNLQEKLDDFEADLEKTEMKKNQSFLDNSLIAVELEQQLSAKENRISELQTSLSDMRTQHQKEMTVIQDELDMYKEQDVHFSELESQVSLYKKQIAELSPYKKQVKEVQEQNEELQKKVAELSELSSDAENLQQNLNYYKDQLIKEKEKVAEMTVALEKRRKEIGELSRTKEQLNEKKGVLKREIVNLQEELERFRTHTDSSKLSDDSFNVSKGLQGDLEEQIRKLETENKVLQAQLGNSSILEELNQQIDEAFLAQKQAEDRLAAQKSTNRELSSEIKQLKSQQTEFEAFSNAKISEINEILSVAQQQNYTYELKLSQLESTVSEHSRLKEEKDSLLKDLKALYLDKDKLTETVLDSKEESHNLLTQLTEVQSTVRALERENTKLEKQQTEARDNEKKAANQLEILKKSMETNAENVEKVKYLELQRDMLKLETEISNYKLLLREEQEKVQKLNQEKYKIEAELRQSLEDQTHTLNLETQKELQELKNLLDQKDQEIAFLNKLKEEIAFNCNKEIKMMSMVVHEVGLDIMRVNRSMKNDKLKYLQRPAHK